MAKDKDRVQNPAAAQRKAEKQKALKKGRRPYLFFYLGIPLFILSLDYADSFPR